MNIMSPFDCKGLNLRNRVVLPPMCQYSVEAKDGKATDWHYVHYVSRAIGGTGLILMEMTNVEPRGRISDHCLGIWSDDHVPPLARIVAQCHHYGSKMGIQIGHAGRKATDAPEPVSSGTLAFSEEYKTPKELTTSEVYEVIDNYADGIRRAVEAGFDTIEIHGAHGYLIHQFHSPLTNQRTDEFGKDKALFGKKIIEKAKTLLPKEMPLIFRISALEYVEGGYGLDYATSLCQEYHQAGVDIFHITSGGEGPLVGSAGKIGAGPGYQLSLARTIKQKLNVPVIAVGRLDSPALADAVIANGDADLVAVGRGMLRNPNWTLEACVQLGIEREIPKPLRLGFPKPR